MTSRIASLARWIVEPDDEPAHEQSPHRGVALLRLAARTAFLLVTFVALRELLVRVLAPIEEEFTHTSFLWECLQRRAAILLPVFAVFSVLAVLVPRVRQGWSQFEGGGSLRWFIGALAAILGWAGAAYTYNAWFDQAHLADRGVVLALAALVWWRPVFVLPFTCVFWIAIQQFHFPDLGYQSLEAEFKPLAWVLVLFSSTFLIYTAAGARKMNGFVFLTLCLVCANFWVPGLGKLRMDWLVHDRAALTLASAYTHGWLAFLEPQTIASITRGMSAVDGPMRVGALLIECVALLFFLNARCAKWLLVLFTLLLGAFFLTFGYLFWKWMLLHVLLFVLVFRDSDSAGFAWRRALFNTNTFVVSLVVIGGASRWFAPARLAWWDTPLANTIRYEAITRGGTSYDLSPNFFAPYESPVAMASFLGLVSPRVVLTGAYGSTHDASVAVALYAARTPQDIVRMEETSRATSLVDDVFIAKYEGFVRRTVRVSNRAAIAGGGFHFSSLRLFPPFVCTFARENSVTGGDPIAAVRIYHVSSFFDGKTCTVFRRDLLRTVAIGEPD